LKKSSVSWVRWPDMAKHILPGHRVETTRPLKSGYTVNGEPAFHSSGKVVEIVGDAMKAPTKLLYCVQFDTLPAGDLVDVARKYIRRPKTAPIPKD
jgi:hypothetical protein